MTERRQYRIELPDRAESVALARLFVATVLRGVGVDEGTVGDAKLAVSELVSISILDSAAGDAVTVAITSAPASLTIAVSPMPEQPHGDSRERLDIASALFPSTEMGDGARAAFSVDLAVT